MPLAILSSITGSTTAFHRMCLVAVQFCIPEVENKQATMQKRILIYFLATRYIKHTIKTGQEGFSKDCATTVPGDVSMKPHQKC